MQAAAAEQATPAASSDQQQSQQQQRERAAAAAASLPLLLTIWIISPWGAHTISSSLFNVQVQPNNIGSLEEKKEISSSKFDKINIKPKEETSSSLQIIFTLSLLSLPNKQTGPK